MKYILVLLFTGFISAETFKSWEANFEFTHFDYGKFKMQRQFINEGGKIITGFKLRPLLIFEYSQKSSLIVRDNEVFSVETSVKNNVPGDHPKAFKVKFSGDQISSEELNFLIKRKDRILDQLGSDVQMRINAKNGVERYSLNVIDNDKGNIVSRLYQTIGSEVVETSFGSFDTIKVSATSPESSEIVYFLAPDLDFFVIQSYVQLKNGERNTLKIIDKPKFLEE
tara:strand:- start:1624 stop:2298 length:675 start_codon:yes stop_codon:yes gene_type:complete